MEIFAMVEKLMSDAKAVSCAINEEIEAKKKEANILRLQLGALEQEIQKLSDYREALHMTDDSLGLVCEPVSTPVVKQVKVEPKNIHHSRKPKKIGKFDPNGKKIGEYRSINQAAKELGWGRTSMAKYLNAMSKEKQIRLRGFYLEYIAA